MLKGWPRANMVVEKIFLRRAVVLNIDRGVRGWTPTACLKLLIGGVERRAFSIPQTTVLQLSVGTRIFLTKMQPLWLDLGEAQHTTLGFSKLCVGRSESLKCGCASENRENRCENRMEFIHICEGIVKTVSQIKKGYNIYPFLIVIRLSRFLCKYE